MLVFLNILIWNHCFAIPKDFHFNVNLVINLLISGTFTELTLNLYINLGSLVTLIRAKFSNIWTYLSNHQYFEVMPENILHLRYLSLFLIVSYYFKWDFFLLTVPLLNYVLYQQVRYNNKVISYWANFCTVCLFRKYFTCYLACFHTAFDFVLFYFYICIFFVTKSH